jgi:hypothetical protein
MLVGSMRVSSDTDRQTTDLPRDALLDAEVEARSKQGSFISPQAICTPDDPFTPIHAA